MNYTKINPDNFPAVIDHLRKTFFADEPLNKSVGLCKAGEGHFDLEEQALLTLQNGLSLMAVNKSDNQIAGVILNGILKPGDVEKFLHSLNDYQDEGFRKIFYFLGSENHKLNLFDKFTNIDKIFEIKYLSVDSKFRNQGVAKELFRQSEKIAIENGFKMFKTDATGLFSQKLFKSFEFKILSEISYKNYVNKDGVPIFNVDEPHDKLLIMYKFIM